MAPASASQWLRPVLLAVLLGPGCGAQERAAGGEDGAARPDAQAPEDLGHPGDGDAALDAATEPDLAAAADATPPDGATDLAGLPDQGSEQTDGDAEALADGGGASAEDGGDGDTGAPADGALDMDAGRSPGRCGPCPAGQLCDPVQGRCVPRLPCAAQPECRAGSECVEPGTCLQAPMPPCAQDADCPARWSCQRWRGGACVPPPTCLADGDCWPAAHCLVESGRCTGCALPQLPCPGAQRCLPGPSPLLASCGDAGLCFADEDCQGERRCVAGSCLAPHCRDDAFEPNSAPFQAAELQPRTYRDLVLCGRDTEDWYRLRPPAGAGVRVGLRQPGPSPLRLGIYAPGALPTLLDEDAGGASRAQVQVAGTPGAADDYLLRVQALDGQRHSYELRLEFVEDGLCPGDAWDRQAGDPAPAPLQDDEATAVLCPRTLDRFVSEGQQGEEWVLRVEVSAEGVTAPQALLQALDGTVLAGGESTPGGWQTRAVLPDSGPWLVLVSGDPPVRGVEYRLVLERGPNPTRERCEHAPLLEPGLAAASSPRLQDLLQAGCATGADRPEGVARLELSERAAVRIIAPTDQEPDAAPDLGVVLSLRQGCGAQGTELACGAGGLLELPALPAGRYQVLAERWGSPDPTPVPLLLQTGPAEAPPAHGQCAEAVPLALDEVFAGSLRAATPGTAPRACRNIPAGAAALFHTFALTSTSRLELEASSLGPLSLCLLAGCEGPNLAEEVEQPVLQPGRYVVVVAEAEPGRGGEYRLAVHAREPPPPPAHTRCAEARPLDDGVTLVDSTAPALDAARPSCSGAGPDLFYRVRVPEALPGRPRVMLVWPQADFEWQVSLATACEATPLGCWSAGEGRRVRAEVYPGEILLGVDGDGPQDWGRFELVVSLPAPVAGDRCGAPQPLAVGQAVDGDGTGAVDDVDPGATAGACGPLPGPDVFYAVSLAAGERLSVRLRPDGWDGALYLLGSCRGACLAVADVGLAGEDEALTYIAPQAGRYLLGVDSFGGYGSYRLERR